MDDTTTWLDYAAAIGSTGSALAAGWAAWAATRAARNTARSTEASLAIASVESERWQRERFEAGTANLLAHGDPPRLQNPRAAVIVVTNRGPAPAYGVTFEHRPPDTGGVEVHAIADLFPWPYLPAQGSIKVAAMLRSGGMVTTQVLLRWDDPSHPDGTEEEFTVQLTR